MSERPYELPSHALLVEPQLSFHPMRLEDRHVHPLKGLMEFGPYSRSLVNHIFDPIRVAAIFPHGQRHVIQGIMQELEARHQPKERRQYLIEYPGFSRVFGLRVVPAQPNLWIEMPGSVDDAMSAAEHPHLVLAEVLSRAVAALQRERHSFEVVLIYLPLRWQPGFYGKEGEDYDLHDFLKASAASQGIPVQIIREDKALAYPCRASVMWRMAIALYCKAGGVPWKLADVDLDTAYVGLSYAMRPTEVGRPRFVTCCSQVFDADGAGLEFIAYETDDVHVERENPFLNRSEMRRVMARSLGLYQRRHAGRSPKRIVIHKSTEFKPEEVDGCFDALQSTEMIELVQVQQDVIWRGIQLEAPRRPNEKGVPSGYPCRRGSYLQLGGREVLLWTQGNAPTAVGGKDFFKEGKGIPHPLRLVRFAGHGGWEEGCQAVLGLTKMDWNNDALYDRLPVTLEYANILARTLKRMPQIAPKPYEFRFFM